MGGYRPIRVVERGGWMAALGMSRAGRSASSLRRARDNFSTSPHGSLSTLVNRRMMRGHSLISTHGGLLLLAVPFQILLVTIPLTLVMMVPESIVRLNRRLELAIFVVHRWTACSYATLSSILSKVHRYSNVHTSMADLDDKTLLACTGPGIVAHGAFCKSGCSWLDGSRH